jgi:hypothetical protein
METIKAILLLVLSLIFGFGFWYLIFWFLTSEMNLFIWPWWVKGLYLIFSFAATGGTFELFTKE